MDYRRLYDRMAPVYGWFWERMRLWRRYSELLLPELEGAGEVLEIGPGPGLVQARLAARHARAFGLDLSMGMLERCQARLRAEGRVPRLVQGEVTRLPFAEGSFDAVAMSFVLSAVPDGDAALREILRVLRPGGRLVLVDAGVPADGSALSRGLGWCWERFGDFMREEDVLMREAGFEAVQRRDLGVERGIRVVTGRKPAG